MPCGKGAACATQQNPSSVHSSTCMVKAQIGIAGRLTFRAAARSMSKVPESHAREPAGLCTRTGAAGTCVALPPAVPAGAEVDLAVASATGTNQPAKSVPQILGDGRASSTCLSSSCQP